MPFQMYNHLSESQCSSARTLVRQICFEGELASIKGFIEKISMTISNTIFVYLWLFAVPLTIRSLFDEEELHQQMEN